METTIDEVKPITGKGGYRPGAGRKKGSKNLLNLPKKAILEFTSPQELKNMVERAKRFAKKDPKMLQWYLEQIFGKAKVIEREGGDKGKTTNNIAFFLDKLEKEDGQKIIGQVMEITAPVYDQGPQPEQDSVCSE